MVPKYDSGLQDETDFPGPEHAGNMTADIRFILLSAVIFPDTTKNVRISNIRKENYYVNST